jgi:hypothetical protein
MRCCSATTCTSTTSTIPVVPCFRWQVRPIRPRLVPRVSAAVPSAGDLLYVTGDTVWQEDTAEVVHLFSPKVVLLFAGAAEPRGRFHMTMGSEDALEAAHAFPNATLVAAHNEG